MTYKLINRITNEENVCSKVVIDGFDYYVSQITYVDKSELFYNTFDKTIQRSTNVQQAYWINKVIATNNPNLDIFQVVDNYKNAKWWAADLNGYDKNCELPTNDVEVNSFIEGYNKSQETHPNSDEDMIEFLKFHQKTALLSFDSTGENHGKSYKEILQIWKERKPKTVYYE